MTLPLIICSLPLEDGFTFSEDTHAHMYNENSCFSCCCSYFSPEEISYLLQCENVSSFRAKNTFQSSSKVDMPSEIVNSQSFLVFFFLSQIISLQKNPPFFPHTLCFGAELQPGAVKQKALELQTL